MRVAVQNLDGVESADVSLRLKTAEIKLRPGNRITLPQLRNAIKDSGFNAREATISVVGSLVERGGKPALQVSGLSTVLLLASDPSKPDAYKEAVRRVSARDDALVEVVGLVNTPSNPSDPEAVIVESLTPAR